MQSASPSHLDINQTEGIFCSHDEICQIHVDGKGPICSEKTILESNSDNEQKYPDGGLRAWLVVCGTWCCTFSTFGFANAWGVFQAYYETHTLKDSSPFNIAWIGSLQYAIMFLPALIIGRMFDLGWFRLPLALGSLSFILAIFLTAECKVYWHFLLCQGILVGVAGGVTFGPVIAIIGHWFNKKRGLALGIMSLGVSVGGVIFPIAARELIPKVGFPWAMRILGFIHILSLGISFLTMARRLPGKNVPGGILNWRSMKSPQFAIFCISTFVTFLGLNSLLTFIDISAEDVGVSPNFAFYLVSISNASCGFGKIISGFVVDQIGAVNSIVPMTVMAAVVIYVWPLAHTQSQLIAIAILYGLTTSAYLGAWEMPVYYLGDIGDVGRRAGVAMLFAAVGSVVGPPISGAISGTGKTFSSVGYYSGSMLLFACILLLITRHLHLQQFRGKF